MGAPWGEYSPLMDIGWRPIALLVIFCALFLTARSGPARWTALALATGGAFLTFSGAPQ